MSHEEKEKRFSSVPSLDLSALNNFGRVPAKSTPDFITPNTRGRDLYGRLSFNTGIFWLGGFASGGVYGFVEGWRTAASPNIKIRFNSVMNAISRRGSVLGSSLGIIAFLHTTGVYASDTLELEKVTGMEAATPIFAGLVTGGVFKMSRGPRAAALASVIGATASTAYWFGSSFVLDVVMGRSGRY